MKEQEIERIVKQTIENTFIQLGITLDNPTEMQKDVLFLREQRLNSDDKEILTDMIYLRRMRKGSLELTSYVKRSAIWAAICSGAWMGLEVVKHFLHIKGG